MPKMTPDNNRILLIRLVDFVPENLVFEDAMTVFSMMYDIAIITPEEEDLADGETLIFDFKGFSARHLARIGISSMRCFIKYLTDAHPLRIKGVHIVNSHSLLDKLLILTRPFLGAKAMDTIHFHLPNSTTLFDFVPKNCLPHEFEGTFGPIDTLKWFWINRTDDHRSVVSC